MATVAVDNTRSESTLDCTTAPHKSASEHDCRPTGSQGLQSGVLVVWMVPPPACQVFVCVCVSVCVCVDVYKYVYTYKYIYIYICFAGLLLYIMCTLACIYIHISVASDMLVCVDQM